MKISIVTVCYNSAATIRDTIESVLAQTYPDIEYIVVDGASRDATLAIVNEYKGRIARVISEPDKGIYDAMNKGVQAATGDLIGILNSDDFYETTQVLAEVAACFERHPGSDLVFGDLVYVQPENLQKVVRFYGAGHFQAWKLRFGWMPPHPATFISKRAYELVGPYSLAYRISADYEMFVRLLLVHNLRFNKLAKVLVRMRVGGVSASGFMSKLNGTLEDVRACRSNGIYTNLLFVLTKLPFKLLELLRKPAPERG